MIRKASPDARWRSALRVAVPLVVASAISAVAAQETREATILHEHFDADAARVGGPRVAEPTSDARVIHAGVQLPAPATEVEPGSEEPLLGVDGARSADGSRALGGVTNGPGNTDQGRMRLDADTQREGTLNYHSVFNPSVVPFKRAGVLDKVVVTRGGEYVLEVADTRLRRIEPTEDAVVADRDRFWGSLVLEATRGKAIPIPSVAPGARILSVETHPPVTAEFLVDGADNMFVRLDHDGTVRLNFITDARTEYFAPGPMPRGVRVRDASSYSRPPGLDKRGPARDAARQVVRAIGISRDDEFGDALFAMVEYFRDFDPSPLDRSDPSGDLYLDVALGRRGVCRHRAFAFVATAQYLGIHARYVYNEAHAFVEVFVPTRGWVRIDLGGGAEGLQVHNTDTKIMHDSQGGDPFPRPQRYLDEVTRVTNGEPSELAGGFERVEGLPRSASDITAEASAQPSDAPNSRGSAGTTQAAGTGTSEGPPGTVAGSGVDAGPLEESDGAADGGPDEPAEEDAGSLFSSQPAPGVVGHGKVVAARPVLARSEVVLSDLPENTWRGQSVTISGTLRGADGDVPLAARTVQVLLVPAVGTPGVRTPLGIGETDANGHFSVAIELPQTVPPGKWDLFAFFPGDTEFAASRSE